jgi:hypothetical protein
MTNVNAMNMNDENRNTAIVMLRLLNGDEIIGKVGTIGNMIKVIKPAAVLIQPSPSGKSQMALVDFIPMARTKEIILDPRNVLFTYDPDTQVENAYNQNFGSGLVMPPKGILTTTS